MIHEELFLDDITFRDRLAKQLEEQAQWDVPRPKKEKKNKSENKPEKPKRPKRFRQAKNKEQDPIIHFDPASEEMLQIVCSGRFRPKNYANFILPKEKYVNKSLWFIRANLTFRGDVIYQRMVLFLSGSKEERLKAYLNLGN